MVKRVIEFYRPTMETSLRRGIEVSSVLNLRAEYTPSQPWVLSVRNNTSPTDRDTNCKNSNKY